MMAIKQQCFFARADENRVRQKSKSSLKRCEEFVAELLERNEVWPFRRPITRKEVCSEAVLCLTR